jgi:predicted dehydrogenase
MTESLPIGIVGLGSIGTYHAEHLTALTTDYEITLAGGMDVAERARETFTETFDVPTYETRDALYEAVEAVIITTPNRYHEEYAVAALEAGIDVLLEKPLAHTLASAERIVAAATGSTATCMVGFHNRFARPVQVLAGYLQADRFGPITHIDATYVRRRGVPARGSWFTDKAVAGGGALVDIGTHAIDLALHLLDFPAISDIAGVTRSVFGGQPDYTYLDMHGEGGDGPFDVDDSATAFIQCTAGPTIALDVAWAANRPPETTFMIRGEDAGAQIDLVEGDLTIFETSATGTPHFSDTEVTTRETNAHQLEQRHFIETIATDSQSNSPSVEQALTVQRVMDAIYRSHEQDATMELDDTPTLTVEDQQP